MLYGWSRLEQFRGAAGTRRGWEDPLPDAVAAARDLFVSAMSDGVKAAEPTPDEAHASHGHDTGPPIRPDASPHALHGYGATFLYARHVIDPAIAALERAARLLPGDDQIAADFVLLHAHAGNHYLAWELRSERLLGRVVPALDAEVEKLLVEESLHAADHILLVEEKPGPAIALVERAAGEVSAPATRQELERLLSQMRQVAAELGRNDLFDSFVLAYEDAKRLVGERRFAEARALLEPFAAEDVDAAVRDPARDALRQIDQVDPPR
jgi:hypothetical protein